MRKIGKWYIFALVLGVALFFHHDSKATDQTLELSSEQWREDLHFMVREAVNTHVNLYHTISRESFDSAVAAIDRDISNLSRNQIIVRFVELVSAIGDGHTSLRPRRVAWFHQYPFELYLFKDGWFVRGAMPGYENAVGSRVVSIDGIPIDEVYERLKVIISRDNEWTIKSNALSYITVPELLNGLGIIKKTEGVVFALKDYTGAEFTLVPELVTIKEFNASRHSNEFIYANDKSENPLPLWLKHLDKVFWYEYVEKSNALYVHLQQISNSHEESLADFTERMFAEVDRLSVDKLIIDLRINHGGNNFLSKPLFHGLMSRPDINQEGKLFVIMGRNTFSAASHLVTYLETHTNALFVGEPMGGSPNSYGDARTVILPNSGLEISFSTLYWQNSTPIEKRNFHAPYLSTPQTSAEFFNNIDPAMNAIMQYQFQAPLAERLTKLVTSGSEGFEQAKEELASFVSDPLHEYRSAESDVNLAGYNLLGKREIDLALQIFKLNTEIYPEQANTWDSYAEALAAKGDTSAAILNYEKSLKLNPQNNNAREMIEKLARR